MSSRRSLGTVILGVVVLGTLAYAGWRKPWRQVASAPEVTLYRDLVPAWAAARANGSPALEAFGRVMAGARPWTGVAEALRAVDAAWGNDTKGPEGWTAAISRLNAANEEAHLPFWIVSETPGGHSVLLTYSVAGRSRWEMGARHVEVLNVQRLDKLNIDLAALGHAHGDRPVVLLGEVEQEVIRHLQEPQGGSERGATATDAAARDAWQQQLAGASGEAAVRATSEALAARGAAFIRVNASLARLNVVAEPPVRFDDGRAVADDLEKLLAPTPYASLAREDLRALRSTSDSLTSPPVRAVLEQARNWEAAATAAHEARHALASAGAASDPAPLPPLVLEVAGHLSESFQRSIASELGAYLGELHDATSPPCLALAGLAEQVRGRQARPTPHFYAGWLIFRELAKTAAGEPADPGDAAVAAELSRRCHEAPATLRNELGAMAPRLLGQPFTPARAAP